MAGRVIPIGRLPDFVDARGVHVRFEQLMVVVTALLVVTAGCKLTRRAD
ncbi:hypothetical protein [Sulfuriferula plumbiphila]|nr:hypothetical protein [Sulfuriferula plumbiphila]